MANGANTTIAATVANTLVTAIANQQTSGSNSSSTLGGLINNLLVSTATPIRMAICERIASDPTSTPVAVMLAEKLWTDLQIVDPVIQSQKVNDDLRALQAVEASLVSQTGMFTRLRNSLGI